MIKLTDKIPQINAFSAELVKIRCLYDCYKDDNLVLFWVQNGDKAVISLADGNMTIFNNGADLCELAEFVAVISPASVFSDAETLNALGCSPYNAVNVLHIKANATAEINGDELSSKEVYDLLNVEGLSLPEYPFFAVDYCRRLNKGGANYFALKEKCAVITFNSGNTAILNGIASHQKGYGSIALKSALALNNGRDFFVCCRNSVLPFYEKNGLKKLYNAGYWVKIK